jgi:hypothetical protein
MAVTIARRGNHRPEAGVPESVARGVLLDSSPLQVERTTRKAECSVLTCDYNGWNDAPEEEREWFDQHPEIWSGPARDPDTGPLRLTGAVAPRIRRRW